MPTATSLNLETEAQLCYTADLLDLAAKAIRRAQETDDVQALFGAMVGSIGPTNGGCARHCVISSRRTMRSCS